MKGDRIIASRPSWRAAALAEIRRAWPARGYLEKNRNIGSCALGSVAEILPAGRSRIIIIEAEAAQWARENLMAAARLFVSPHNAGGEHMYSASGVNVIRRAVSSCIWPNSATVFTKRK